MGNKRKEIRLEKGFEILFTGLDGCGKTTLLEMVKEWLEREGYKTRVVKAAPLAKNWDKFPKDVLDVSSDQVKFMLHLIQHIEMYYREIKPSFDRGEIVLRDRGIIDLLVYGRLFKLGEHEGMLWGMMRVFVKEWYTPKIIFFVNTDLKTISKRLKQRKEKEKKLKESLATFKADLERYSLGEAICILIDGNVSKEKMFKQTKASLEPIFKEAK